MRLVEIDEGALDLIRTGLDAIRFGKASAKDKMAIAKANPPRQNKDNRTRQRSGGSDDYDHLIKKHRKR